MCGMCRHDMVRRPFRQQLPARRGDSDHWHVMPAAEAASLPCSRAAGARWRTALPGRQQKQLLEAVAGRIVGRCALHTRSFCTTIECTGKFENAEV